MFSSQQRGGPAGLIPAIGLAHRRQPEFRLGDRTGPAVQGRRPRRPMRSTPPPLSARSPISASTPRIRSPTGRKDGDPRGWWGDGADVRTDLGETERGLLRWLLARASLSEQMGSRASPVPHRACACACQYRCRRPSCYNTRTSPPPAVLAGNFGVAGDCEPPRCSRPECWRYGNGLSLLHLPSAPGP
jgi:hypothetical protein